MSIVRRRGQRGCVRGGFIGLERGTILRGFWFSRGGASRGRCRRQRGHVGHGRGTLRGVASFRRAALRGFFRRDVCPGVCVYSD